MGFTAEIRKANNNGTLELTIPKREAKAHGFKDGQYVDVELTAIDESR